MWITRIDWWLGIRYTSEYLHKIVWMKWKLTNLHKVTERCYWHMHVWHIDVSQYIGKYIKKIIITQSSNQVAIQSYSLTYTVSQSSKR